MLKHRKYKSGSRWALWRWTFVPSEFITRLILLKTPSWSLIVHWINKPDPEPFMHDHPAPFWSLIWKGSYVERRWTGEYHRGDEVVWCHWRRRFNRFRAHPNDRHQIIAVHPKGAVTLCFMGKKTREWGYHTGDGGWIYWRDYQAAERLAGPGGDPLKHVYPTITDKNNQL
jgi:hypothetical protein